MSGSRVSVVIPTYNRARYIEECLDSLLAQSVAPMEIIVVDDGSTDDTAQRLAKYGERIVYLKKDNGGKPNALNMAMPLARGDYLWLFDDDDVALPDAIEKRLAILQRDATVGFVYSSHYLGHDGADGKIARRARHDVPAIADDDFYLQLMQGCYFMLQSVLARREVFAAAGQFDPTLVAGEDYDMMIRMARLARGALLPEPTFIFRQHAGLRGPSGQRYTGNDRQAVFRKFDYMVGMKARAALAMGDYLCPRLGRELDPAELRAALFARAGVMASKGAIQEMLADIGSALQTGRPAALAGRERRQCIDAVCTGYAYAAIDAGWDAFADGARALLAMPGGRAAVRALALGLVRLAKSYPGSAPERLQQLRQAARMLAQSFRPGRRAAVIAVR